MELNIAFYIGLLAGAIFFIDGWGPSEKGTSFLESRRFRGLSIIISGSVITPALDYVMKSKGGFFLQYLFGCVWGWFFVFLLGLILFSAWKLTKYSNNGVSKVIGRVAFTVLDFIYLGISDNPHLNAERDAEINVDKINNQNRLNELQKFFEHKNTTPNQIDEETRKKLLEYEKKLKTIKVESDYDFSDWFIKAIAEFDSGHFEKAIAYSLNALEKKGKPEEEAEANLYLALAYDELSLKDKSIEIYYRILDKFPDYTKNFLVLYDLATSLYERGDFGQARGYFLKALEKDKKFKELWFNYGLNEEDSENYEEALKAYDAAIETGPPEAEDWERKVTVLLAMKKYDEAMKSCEKGLKINGKYADLWILKGDIFYEQMLWEEAISAYRKADTLEPGNKILLTALANALEEGGQFTEALTVYDRLLQLEATDLVILKKKAIVLYEMERLPESSAIFKQITDSDPENLESWLYQGYICVTNRNWNEGMKFFNKVLDIDPRNTDALYQKGIVLENLGQTEKAVIYYKRALKYDPDNIDIRIDLSKLLADQKNFADAEPVIDAALRTDPESAEAWFNKGVLQEGQNKLEDALRYYGKSLELNPKDQQTMEAISQVKQKLGNF